MIFNKKKSKPFNVLTFHNNPFIPEKEINKPFYSFERDGLTSSMLTTFLACRMKAKLSYLEGWGSEKNSNAMTFGSLFHECLDWVYSGIKIGKAIDLTKTIDAVLAKYKKDTSLERIWTPEDEQDFQLNEGYIKILLPAYLKKYEKSDKTYKWVLIEDQFNNIYEGVRLRGKFDRVAENKNGETWLFETKTKGRIDPDIQTRLSFDPQLMIYLLNYELSTGVRPTGFIYDIIQRPALHKGKVETLKHFMDRVKGDVDDSYFFRIQQRLDSKEFSEWKLEFSAMLIEFKAWVKGKVSTIRNPASCETRYGNCQFLKVCGAQDFIGLKKRKHVMPELVE